MRDSRLQSRPPALPIMPPGLFTLPRVLPLFGCFALLTVCTRLAFYGARHARDLSLFMQCLCAIANGWFVLRIAAGFWFGWCKWFEIRRSYHALLDELEGIASMHLRMIDDGVSTPDEVELRLTEFAEHVDERIRMAFDRNLHETGSNDDFPARG
jgi:hypothetical protein